MPIDEQLTNSPFTSVFMLKAKAENQEQGQAQADAAIDTANKSGKEFSFDVEGNPLLVAGVNIKVTGLGKLSGVWHIIKSVHKIDRTSGYTTSIECKKVGDIDAAESDPLAQEALPDNGGFKGFSGGDGRLGSGEGGSW